MMRASFTTITTTPSILPRLKTSDPPDLITLTITNTASWPYIYTTTIRLGDSTLANPYTYPTPPPDPPSPYIAATTSTTPTQTDSNPTSPSTTSHEAVVLGATLGSIFGLLVVIAICYVCCFRQHSVTWVSPANSLISGEGGKMRRSRRRWRRSTRAYGYEGYDWTAYAGAAEAEAAAVPVEEAPAAAAAAEPIAEEPADEAAAEPAAEEAAAEAEGEKAEEEGKAEEKEE